MNTTMKFYLFALFIALLAFGVTRTHYARPAGQRRRGPSQAYRQQEKLLDRADAAFFLAHAASVTAACT